MATGTEVTIYLVFLILLLHTKDSGHHYSDKLNEAYKSLAEKMRFPRNFSNYVCENAKLPPVQWENPCKRPPPEESKFLNNATGYLGKKRPTMLENVLLIKKKIGESNTMPINDLPPADFVYGMPLYGQFANAGTTADALKDPVKKQMPEAEIPPHKVPIRYVHLNKVAIRHGVSDAKMLTEFVHHHYRRPMTPTRSKPPTPPPYKKKDTIFGDLTFRDKQTVAELIDNRYQGVWIKKTKDEQPPPKQKLMWRGTGGHLLRYKVNSYFAPEKKESFWHLPKFDRHARPRICSFRSDTQRTAAERAHSLDRVARLGLQGHGIYKTSRKTLLPLSCEEERIRNPLDENMRLIREAKGKYKRL